MARTRTAIPLAWTRHLKGKDKEDFEIVLRNSTLVLSRLKTILEDELLELQKQEINPSAFETPNWPYLQAYVNGRKSQIKNIIDHISFI